jgi:glycosyltransferase involved in cell wall biosynthesis
MQLLRNHITILASADNVADGRLHRLTKNIIKCGISVDIWALGHSADAPQDATFHRAPGNIRKLSRIWRDLILPGKAVGEVVMVISPDLVPMAYLITRIKRQKLIVDVYENYPRLLADRAWAKGLLGILAKTMAKVSTFLAARADLTTVADIQVPPFKARNRIVIKNLPETEILTQSGELDQIPRAIYIGDVRKSRGLHKMLEVAELATAWNFDIIGNVASADQEFVTNWQRTSSASSRVKFHGRLTPIESWKFAKGAWVGLTLLDSTPAFIEAVPSKLYEYAACGLATISTSLPRCVELISQSGGGKIADSAREVSVILDGWQANPKDLEAIRANAHSWAKNELNSQAQYAQFGAAVKNLTTRAR